MMDVVVKVAILAIAAEHLFILWIEMFNWTKKGDKIASGATAQFLAETKSMAANQGLYNGFLAAGLIWSILIQNPEWSKNISEFFLGCVVVAGVYGAITAARSIFFKQALPAILALIIVILF